MEKIDRKIALEGYYHDRPLYEDELGWQKDERNEARSEVSKEIFQFEIIEVGYNLAFYYLDNDTFYGLHTERLPIEFKILPRDRSMPYIDWQCNGDTHDEGEILYSFNEQSMDIWNTIKIDGKSLEDVLERSVIWTLN